MAKWTFAESQVGQMDQGPNNSTAEHFKSHDVFSSLVRESIQNSLDVPHDTNKPVVVKYAFGTLSEGLTESIREVEGHIYACKVMYPDSTAYGRMVEFLDTHKNQLISFLRVSDYNTLGMDYNPSDETHCGFYSFVQSIGNSSKGDVGSGGSYGFGKAAYYEFSNSRSILVSSKTTSGEVAFQGCSMLCTHNIEGKKYSFSGFYDDGDGKPIQNEELIPEELKRKESGSDIYLLHVQNDLVHLEKYQKSMIESVLLNFWMAIYAGKLEVTFDWQDDGTPEITISKDTLEELMLQYFPSLKDDNDVYSNPRPYYEAVKKAVCFDDNAEEAHDCVFFETNEPFGHMKFYLMRNVGTRDRYVYMRKPLMVINGQKMNGQRGISGVLICDGEANNYLSKAEPPAHDKWDMERVKPFKDDSYSPEGKAYKTISYLKNWCRDNVKAFFASKNATETEVEGLDNYLYATEEISQKGQGQAMTGIETDLFSMVETGAHDTKPQNLQITTPTPPPITNAGQVTISVSQPSGIKSGDDTGTSRTNTSHRGNDEGLHTGGQKIQPTEPEYVNEPIPQQQIKPVKFRSSAKLQDDNLEYHLIIYTHETLENANVFVSTVGEDGTDIIPVVWANKGSVRPDANAIYGVTLLEGTANRLAFRFEDNIKHIISLTVYVTR